LVVDTSDITKKFAKKMEYLCEVRDGSEGEIGLGYWMGEVVGAEVLSMEITPLAQSVWSQESPGFTSENDEILSLMQRVRQKTELCRESSEGKRWQGDCLYRGVWLFTGLSTRIS